ncbi:hypothetical protein M407DRAFT_222948 [Tulasnella calospora MUT 4182]|uniref:Uncharacterized protein n=1 Tax=Tulasnella calospora MUT 4182 TaxID=1051891 RepID=A0A0C3QS32_9AGAM|nr:hypothetical protein M407DRAFT_222948 [Tulasnella calospora MUT 4182]
MKSARACGSIATLLLACSAVRAVVCPYILPAKFPNPFAASALPGWYLEAGSAYKFLNAAVPTGAVGYENLTWEASPVTYWNATVGSPLSTIVDGKSVSKFIACKSITSVDSSYVLFLQTGAASTVTGAPSSIDTATCVVTKIIIT